MTNINRQRSLRPRGRVLVQGLGIIGLTVLGGGATVMGCLDRPIEPVEPRTTATVVERITQSGVDKIDILLAIDNSASMADKQVILAEAVPDLVNKLLNPDCVKPDPANEDKVIRQPTQPADPGDACESGYKREFPPVLDVNIGIVSSSLGSLGAGLCNAQLGNPPESNNPTNNDNGHLIWRTNPSPSMSGNDGPDWNDKGFLAWDGATPPKRSPAAETDIANLGTNLGNMVKGVGQVGCGFEMTLEAVYRFLVDPAPYEVLEKVMPAGGGLEANVKKGLDTTITTQRADFLRPNSLLAIIILSDENDCSVQAEGQNWALLRSSSNWYRGSSVCASNPADPCCYSCGLPTPAGCSADPICATNPSYTGGSMSTEDPLNLRCADHKRKYGLSLLYPVKRYVNAFTQLQINVNRPDLALDPMIPGADLNPLFRNLQGTPDPVRDPGLVFVAGIVGVPWQAAARLNAGGNADLKEGFQNYDELRASGFFEKYVGNPDEAVYPTEPIMLESATPRPGVPNGNPFNGNDRVVGGVDDLQYACRFPIAEVPNGPDCKPTDNPNNDNPLCMGTTQVYAKAYPGTRQLAVLAGIGGQGIVASVCPANTTDKTATDYGYRPAVQAIIDRLKVELAGQCLPRKLVPDGEGNIPCVVLAAQQGAQTQCLAENGRQDVSPEHQAAARAAANDPLAPKDPSGKPLWTSFCEVIPLQGNGEGEPRNICQTVTDEDLQSLHTNVNGWCYVDPDEPPNDPARLVADCPENEKHIVRFANKGQAASGETFLITCSGENQ